MNSINPTRTPQSPAKTLMDRLQHTLLITLFLLVTTTAQSATVLDEIAAIVNDDIILKSDLDNRVNTLMAQLRTEGMALPEAEQLEKDVLERMVIESLQLQIAKKLNITIGDDVLNETVANMALQNGISVQDFIEKLREENINYSRFRADLATELLLQRVQQNQVSRRVSISASDVERFKQAQGADNDTQYHIAHILLEYGVDADADTRASVNAQAQALRAQALTQDFATLAQTHSTASSAANGGDLGWRSADALPGIFKQATLNLAVGDVSAPIETASGVHLIKLIDKSQAETPTTLITEHLTRHILLKTDGLSDKERERKKAELEQIRSQIIDSNDNKTFAALAQKHSDDLGSGAQGGSLGWAREGQMVPSFEDMMTSIALNTVSPVFESPYGWHILEVTQRKQTDVTDQVEENAIRQQIYQQRYQEALQGWLRQLRSDAFVDIKHDS